MTILWVGIGTALRPAAEVFGGLTAVICGVGFIYYGMLLISPFLFSKLKKIAGKDIVMILSKQGKNATHRNLSLKIIIFTVAFVLFVYATVIVYLSNVLGGILRYPLLSLISFFVLLLSSVLSSPPAPLLYLNSFSLPLF